MTREDLKRHVESAFDEVLKALDTMENRQYGLRPALMHVRLHGRV